jgi:GNAT superfamily N-acetyltransferase
MRYEWPAGTILQEVVLEPEERACAVCGARMHICDHRGHKVFTLRGPLQIVSKLCHCPVAACAGHHTTVSPDAELALTMPWWQVGWDVFAWIGQRRLARHWSVPQIRAELLDSYQIVISEDSISRYIAAYQTMLAARWQDPALVAEEYRGVKDVVLSIDGLQPEKGHETLYVVRELRRRRVWFAEPLLSSAAGEVRRLLEEAAAWARRLDLPVRLWVSDKQDAFVSGIREVFPGVPHRYCDNHFLRDVAKPVLERDCHAKVAMRRKVRGLRAIEREVVAARPAAHAGAGAMVLDYCAAVRGVLTSDQGGPLAPPGLTMAAGLREIRGSLQNNLDEKKGAKRSSTCGASQAALTAAWPRSRRRRHNSNRASRTCAR